MDTLDYSEYKFDFSNFKMFLDKFKELANSPYDSLDECLKLLKELLLFQNEVLRISKCACIEYELDNSTDNKDHVQLTFNLYNRIFGLRERIFNTLLNNYKEEEVLNVCDKDLVNYIKKVYYPMKHSMNIDDPDYAKIIRNIDIVWNKAIFNKLELEELKSNTLAYITYNKEMLKMVGFSLPIERELFLDGISIDSFKELLKYNFNEYKEEESTSKIKLKETIGLYNEVFNKYFSEDISGIFTKLLVSNSIRYVVEDTSKKFKVGTYASFGNMPKILLNFDGTMTALYGFIFELGHATVLYKQNNNNVFDYEYNMFIGNIIGYINELLLFDYLKVNNSPYYEDSNKYLSNMLYRANSALKSLKTTLNMYITKEVNGSYEELMNVYHDFGEYREVIGIVLAGYISKKLINNEIDKNKYSEFMGISGNITIKDMFNHIGIDIDDINIIKEGIEFLKELVK